MREAVEDIGELEHSQMIDVKRLDVPIRSKST
jgi:hypothetical protein